jgi:predicted 2-oxoglutarate/Fe(II)-dependent dioxygenase YbiX
VSEPTCVAGLVSTERIVAAEACERLVVALDAPSFSWRVAEVHSGTPEASVKPARQALVAPGDKTAAAAQVVKAIDEYLQAHDLVRQLNLERSPLGILNYGVGGRYTTHRDSGPAHPERVLSLLLYLNDDFEGGTTCFPSRDLEVRPVPGMGVLFDSSLAHSGEPVLRGRKFAMVAWLHETP